jgi:drug/metabolite transporter (DMT)-like permease
MRSIALALGASLSWGLADFFGPLKGRTLGALRVLVYVQLGGLLAIALIVAIRAKGPASATALLAIPAAISGTLGLYAYYRGIAVGAISIVAPIAGISAVIPVAVGIASGDRPSPWQWAGIATSLVGVFLASRENEGGRRVAAGVGLALLAAIGFGSFFVLLDRATEDGGAPWSLLLVRAGEVALLGALALVRSPTMPSGLRDAAPLLLIGTIDFAATAFFALATKQGLLSIVSVVGSLYPAVTVVLARVVLAERVARSQEVGVVLTLAGVVLIGS